ncbi:cob(I)yrinic acid a,c-diamide adenosyltransferase [archaeon]|nr:cob(I)yrinic acid a,c-diamide adenosyltransferase [archaeon]
MIYLFMGNGKGKTTAALGIALRALGQNKKVAVIQFMKGRKNTGEYKIQKKLKNFKVYQFGTREFIDLKKPKQIDYTKARNGWQFARKIKNIDLLILDELNLACAIGLLKTEEVVRDIKQIKNNIHIIITGRAAPIELQKIADYIMVSYPKQCPRHLKAIKGLDY